MVEAFVKKLSRPAHEHGPLNIVCLGDSITQGCFGYNEYAPEQTYWAKLKKLMNLLCPNQIFNFINSGLEGTTAAFAVERLQRDVLKYQPDLVIVKFGVNDVRDIGLYGRSLKTIFETLNRSEIPCIYVTENLINTYVAEDTPKPWLVHAQESLITVGEGKLDRIFETGKAVAAQCGVAVCDLYSKWKQLYAAGVDTTRLLANRINHPVKEMHSLMAYEILSALLFV